MIRFRDMNYYNIHTHHIPQQEEVTAIYNIAVSLSCDGSPAAVPFACRANKPGKLLYSSVGIHPWYIDVSRMEKQFSVFRELVEDSSVVAVGEAGLDKLSEIAFSLQENVFLLQVQVAEELGKPLIIHCVKAWSELIVLRKKLRPRMPWIVHGFRGNKILASQLLAHGFYLSVSDRFNPEIFHTAISSRLFLETDDRETDIIRVYQAVSPFFSQGEESLIQQVGRNVRNVFSI